MSPRPSAGTGDDPAQLLRRTEAMVYVADLDDPELGDADSHHLFDVLRLAPGAVVALGDGAGSWREAVVARVAPEDDSGRHRRGRAPLRVEARGVAHVGSAHVAQLTVGFALQKGDRPELVVQKLTELGVDRIVPFVSDRTVVRLDGADAARRGERLRRVAREAGAQSRRLVLPEVADPCPLRSLYGTLAPRTLLAEPGGGPLPPDAASVLVGPEGGWSPAELEQGLGTVELAKTILRSETAAIVAGAILGARRAGVV